jgi:AcrR family transcriptional regulator
VELTKAQRRLFDAAIEVFAEHGYGGSRTRDIAAKADRSPAAVYVHHSSKEELLFAISERTQRSALVHLQGVYDSHGDPVSRVHAMVMEFSLWHLENIQAARVTQYEMHALTPEHRAVVVAQRREFHRLMRTALEAGIRAGAFEVADLHRTTHSLLALGIDLIRWFDPSVDPDKVSVARHNADLAIRMISSPSPSAACPGQN